MKDLVLIKSFPNGIALHLDKEAPFEELLEEIAYKFSEARAFLGMRPWRCPLKTGRCPEPRRF